MLAAFLQQSGRGAIAQGINVSLTMILSRLHFSIRPVARATSAVTATKAWMPSSSAMHVHQHRFIQGVVSMLKIQQACVYPRTRGASPAWSEVGAKTALDFVPVHQFGESDQEIAHLELLVQAWAGQLARVQCMRSGLHQNLIEICKKSYVEHLFSCKFSLCQYGKVTHYGKLWGA